MPKYSYGCEECGMGWELEFHMGDAPYKVDYPHEDSYDEPCESNTITRIYTPPNIRIKYRRAEET